MTYTPSGARCRRARNARAARAPLRRRPTRAERDLRDRGVHEALRGMLGVHVAHFCPMGLTAQNSLRHPRALFYVPHGPHEVRRVVSVVVAGREARVDPE